MKRPEKEAVVAQLTEEFRGAGQAALALYDALAEKWISGR